MCDNDSDDGDDSRVLSVRVVVVGRGSVLLPVALRLVAIGIGLGLGLGLGSGYKGVSSRLFVYILRSYYAGIQLQLLYLCSYYVCM